MSIKPLRAVFVLLLVLWAWGSVVSYQLLDKTPAAPHGAVGVDTGAPRTGVDGEVGAPRTGVDGEVGAVPSLAPTPPRVDDGTRSAVATSSPMGARDSPAPAALASAHSAGDEQSRPVRVRKRSDRVAMLDGFELEDPAVVVIAYNRPGNLRRTLSSLMGLRGIDNVTVYVSQDGYDGPTANVPGEFPGVTLFHHDREPGGPQRSTGFLARHYRFALGQLLDERRHTHAIIVEDDMEFSPDFLTFFAQTAPLLERDPTIWCVSSWNDNGFKHLDLDPRALFRNSFFPGLGWMLRYDVWNELRPVWPDDHWDHWMRLSTTSRGRDCVCPFVSRNYNFGAEGANMNQDSFNRYLANILHNRDPSVLLGDLSYLIRERYASSLALTVARANQTFALDPAGSITFGPVDLAQARALAQAAPGLPFTVVVATTVESAYTLAGYFSIWHEPRAQHASTLLVRMGGVLFVLADARRSPYLPPKLAVHQRSDLVIVAGERARACDAVCTDPSVAGGRLRCDASQFDFLNRLDVLDRYFTCKSHWFELGEDIPVLVSDPAHENYGRCLVTPKIPTCGAWHPATSRLCPCAP